MLYSVFIAVIALLFRRLTLVGVTLFGFKYDLISVVVSLVSLAVFPLILRKKVAAEGRWFIAFVAWSLVRSVWAIADGGRLGDVVAADFLVLAPMTFYFHAKLSSFMTGELLKFENALLFITKVSACMAIASVLLRLLLNKLLSWGGLYLSSGGTLSRASLPFGGANLVGAYLLLMFPLFLGRYVGAYSPNGRMRSLAWVAIISVAILTTFSAGAIGLWILELGAWFVLTRQRRRGLGRLALALAVVALVGVSQLDLLGSRLLRAESYGPNWGSKHWRYETYREMANYAISHPLLGTGPGIVFSRIYYQDPTNHGVNYIHFVELDGRQVMDQSHSQYLLVLVEYGVPGLLIYLGFLLAILRRLRTAYSRQRALGHERNEDERRLFAYLIGAASFVVWLAVSDALSLQLRLAVLFWLTLGVAARWSNPAIPSSRDAGVIESHQFSPSLEDPEQRDKLAVDGASAQQ